MSYKNNETNKGKKWSQEEINDLTDELTDKMTISEIALSHKRTDNAIKLYGLSLANKIRLTTYKDKTDVNDIYGFTLKEIDEYNKFREKQLVDKEKQQEMKKKEKKETKVKYNPENVLNDSDIEINLNEEQTDIFNKATQTNDNIFLTGSPGTGKSHTLKAIIKYYKESGRRIGVTSTTGCSAILIGARTLHSFLKLGISNKTPQQLVNNLKKYPELFNDILVLETLIIEEISMLSDKMFNNISAYLSLVRKNTKPFGGIQLLLVGDFCQLPPVSDNFCFLSRGWERLNPVIMNLKTLVRQDGDVEFQQILERSRTGKITDDDIVILKKCKKIEDIEYTCLCSTNKEADAINSEELDKLLEHSLVPSIKYVNSLNNKDKLQLCKGCKVMVNWNIDIESKIINGTTGEVLSLNNEIVVIKLTNTDRTYTIKHVNVKDENTGQTLAIIMPLQLAWATTIHKSQGSTIDYLLTNLGNSIFADGQAYVALSRVKTLKNLALIDVTKNVFKTNYNVKQFYALE
jgi:ATP-dependent DNA helicase PIF1